MAGTKQPASVGGHLAPAAHTVPVRSPVSAIEGAADTLRAEVRVTQHKASLASERPRPAGVGASGHTALPIRPWLSQPQLEVHLLLLPQRAGPASDVPFHQRSETLPHTENRDPIALTPLRLAQGVRYDESFVASAHRARHA